MRHETLVRQYGLEDPRYPLRYEAMVGSMLAATKVRLASQFKAILADMRRSYYVEGKVLLTDGRPA